LDNKNCGVCGKEIAGEDEMYCPDCKSAIRRKSRKRLWYSGAAAVILILAGAVFLYGEKNAWEFSWDSLLRRPVAVVNGEPIALSEARERLKIARLMMEKEYGKELFTGERGRAYLRDLERDVLERMIGERLVAQEARRLNIQVGDDRVKKEIQEIGREIYGNWENFQASLKEDGISQEYLSAHVRNLLLCQEIKKAQAPAGADSDEYFSAWLTQDRRSAKVTFNKAISPIEVSSQGQGSCCGTTGRAGGGGCGGGCGGQQAAAGPLDPQLQSEASAAALSAYRKTKLAEKDVAAKVTDYGCHVQVDIEKDGKIVRSYIYQNGSVIDNS
jgi:hypothetical protein